jgi:hypothetical protein
MRGWPAFRETGVVSTRNQWRNAVSSIVISQSWHGQGGYAPQKEVGGWRKGFTMAVKATAAAVQVEPYTKVPNRILRGEDPARPPLKSGPHRLWLILISYNWKRPRFHVSQARLARDCNASIRSIRRWTQILEELGYIKVIVRNGCVHHYELIGDVTVHPGQPVRTADPSPRTTGQYELRNRGQSGSHQLLFKELPTKEMENKEEVTGPNDPWARFRQDPVAQKAAQLAITKKK